MDLPPPKTFQTSGLQPGQKPVVRLTFEIDESVPLFEIAAAAHEAFGGGVAVERVGTNTVAVEIT